MTTRFNIRTSFNLHRCVALALAGVAPLLLAGTFSSAQTFTVLHSFTGGADGGSPYASLLRDAKGNLYGTASAGGVDKGYRGFGLVFRIDSTGKFSVLYRFQGGIDGAYPTSELISDGASLYGTAKGDGYHGGYGVVYKVSSAGQTVLHAFTGGPDGSLPLSGLTIDAAGNLHGTTLNGGDPTCGNGFGCGIVFKIDSAGAETVPYSFSDGEDGGMPASTLLRDAAGNLYGTTRWGGLSSCSLGCGTVFEVDSSGQETVVHHFSGKDGEWPDASLIQDSAGNFYGTTSFGGNLKCDPPAGCGTVFKLDPTGRFTTIHKFSGADGLFPYAPIVADTHGNGYGTTYSGGQFGFGTVYKIDRYGQFSVLHHFTGGTDGGYPNAGLILDPAGSLYGATTLYGGNGTGQCSVNGHNLSCGTVFKLTP